MSIDETFCRWRKSNTEFLAIVFSTLFFFNFTLAIFPFLTPFAIVCCIIVQGKNLCFIYQASFKEKRNFFFFGFSFFLFFSSRPVYVVCMMLV